MSEDLPFLGKSVIEVDEPLPRSLVPQQPVRLPSGSLMEAEEAPSALERLPVATLLFASSPPTEALIYANAIARALFGLSLDCTSTAPTQLFDGIANLRSLAGKEVHVKLLKHGHPAGARRVLVSSYKTANSDDRLSVLVLPTPASPSPFPVFNADDNLAALEAKQGPLKIQLPDHQTNPLKGVANSNLFQRRAGGMAGSALARMSLGIITTNHDFTAGFANNVARELLLGTHSSPEEVISEDQAEGAWSAQKSPNSTEYDFQWPRHPLDSTPLALDDEVPTITSRVSAILYRSYSMLQKRKQERARHDYGKSKLSQSTTANSSDTDESTSPLPTMMKEWLGQYEGDVMPPPPEDPAQAPLPTVLRKRYTVYDPNFAARMLDPLEAMLEIALYQGEPPDVTSWPLPGEPITIGIEVEASSSIAEASTFYNLVEATPLAQSNDDSPTAITKRVRRRVVKVMSKPIDNGCMLLLEDITDVYVPQSVPKSVPKPLPVLPGQSDDSEYYKQMVDTMPQIVFLTDAAGRVSFWNNQWYSFTGLEPNECLGNDWLHHVHPAEAKRVKNAWSESVRTGQPFLSFWRCKRKDGIYRWLLARASCHRDSYGNIQSWCGTSTDIHDQIESQKMVDKLLSCADLIMIAFDKEIRITMFEGKNTPIWKRRLEDTKGWTDLKGRKFDEVFTEPQHGPIKDVIVEVIQKNLASKVIEAQSALNGNWIRCTISPVYDDDDDDHLYPTGVVLIGADVTDLRATESALQTAWEEKAQLVASEAAAQDASRLKSVFLSTVSHEVRTPISGIIGLSEMLLDEDSLTDPHRDSIAKILRAAEVLLELINGLLDLQKIESGKLDLDVRPFRLKDLITDLAGIYGASAQRKGLKYIESIEESLLGRYYEGDIGRIRQVLANLLNNSIKFTSTGSVILGLEKVKTIDGSFRVRFSVRDTGIGIKPENEHLLFRPFQQLDTSTSRLYGGTGLGLSISNELTRMMGGTIALDPISTQPGQGCFMHVEVPLGLPKDTKSIPYIASPPVTPSSTLPIDGIRDSRKHQRVLIADDNPLNIEILFKLCKKLGFVDIITVSDGEKAVAAVSHGKLFDIVLMDIQMPFCDGLTATRRIRQLTDPKRKDVKIVALTASALRGDKEKCLEAQMNDYVSKPVRLNQLDKVLRALPD